MSLAHAKLTPTSAIKAGFESAVHRKLDALGRQGAMRQKIALKVLQLQRQMRDRLTLIQSKTEAILTQQLELVDYPIPRLFIVLPEKPVEYDPATWFRTRFRLYFICECGKHTQEAEGKIANHIHLANHGGYLVRNPVELFKTYGPFLFLMLGLIKFGTNIDGYTVPALASLKLIDLGDSVKQNAETVVAKIDYSLECISRTSNLEASSMSDMDFTTLMTQEDLVNYLGNVRGPRRVELRQVRSYLKTSKNSTPLGNLYRMTNSNGNVKWVCRDHYRAIYDKGNTQKLRAIVKQYDGTFDEQLGKVGITLPSSVAARGFYGGLCKAKGVMELIVDLRWDCSEQDVDELKEALGRSTIRILYVDLQRYRSGYEGTILAFTQRYSELRELLQPMNLKTVHLVLPNNLVTLSNFEPQAPLDVDRLTFEVVIGLYKAKEVRTVVEMRSTGHFRTTLYQWDSAIQEQGALAMSEVFKTNMSLTTLNLRLNLTDGNGAQALSEAPEDNSTFTALDMEPNICRQRVCALSEALEANLTLTSLDLSRNIIQEKEAKTLFRALRTNLTLTTLGLWGNNIGEDGARALSEALKINTSLTMLNLGSNTIGANGARLLSKALKISSTLITLKLGSNAIEENGALALSEEVFWHCPRR